MADNPITNDLALTYSPSHRDTVLPSHNPNYYPAHNGHPMLNQSAHFAGSLSTVNPATALRTFSSTKDLASHYGIPQFLPPVPRTTPRAPMPEHNESDNSPTDELEEFKALQSNYLSMLSSNPTDHTPPNNFIDSSPQLTDLGSPVEAVMHEFMHPLASPEFHDIHGVCQYLTSPLETPYDDFAPSPNDDSPFNDFLTTPLIADDSDPVIVGENSVSLFPEMGTQQSLFGGHVTADTKQQDAPKIPDLDNLYTISPGTSFIDSVDPTAITSPIMPAATSFPSTTRRRTVATGTRKNITPESLIPLDAPTQTRKYATPSSTSRKDVPAVFANKRKRGPAFDIEEEDELASTEPLRPDASEKEKIEWKRRQNTLAARKSRKRKLEHQLYLETKAENLEREVSMWKTRAKTLQSVLRNNNIPVADFPDD